MKRILVSVLLVVGVAVALALTGPKPVASATLMGSTMGTSYTVRLAENLSAAEQGIWQERIQACLDQVDSRMSTYKSDSEVSRFNRTRSDEWFSVSRDTAFVVAAALDVSQATEGAFDITVGPLVDLWHFGPDQRPLDVPSDTEIASARSAVGYHHLEVRLEPAALRKKIPQVNIDLSAIAKGFAVDQVGELLEQGGVRAYMVEVGGEVRTRGTRPDGGAWRIGIERPVVGTRDLELVVNLKDISLATSGDYRNFFEANGRRYSHEIDPHTGRPVESDVAAVSVMDRSTMRADAFATGLMVMPPDKAWQLAGEMGLEIIMMMHRERGFQERTTPGFAAAVAERIP